ncbi:MAG: carbohydrate kinase family protein [Actinomycetota bacterium]|nr:carbohydrate kinase family protein [Actinomycetota bacterium]
MTPAPAPGADGPARDAAQRPVAFVVVGSANFDIVLGLGRLPRPHEKIRAARSTTGPGGAGANTAVWLARLGREVTLVTAVGEDLLGEATRAGLVAEGVDTRFVGRIGGGSTGVAVVLSDGSAKRMVTTGGPPLDDAIDALPRSLFSPGVHLHVAGQERGAATILCREARERGATVSVEANGRVVDGLVPYADLILVNADELRSLTGPGRSGVPARARRLLGAGHGTVVVTRGAAGAVAVSATGTVTAHAQPVTVVDRTGGGDAFDAGFLDVWTGNGDLGRALEAGLALAADVLGHVGARPPLPGR